MASASSCGIDQRMEGETQDTRRVTIALGDEVHLIAQSLDDYTDHSWKDRTAHFFLRWSPSKPVLDSAGQARPPLCRWRWFIRCCWLAPCLFSSSEGYISRLEALCASLSEKGAFRTLLLIYVFLNEVLRYHSGGGAVSVAAAVSEMFLVLLFLLEFVYDSICLGLWRGSAWFFRSRRCVYNLVVLVAAVACGILDIYAKTKPTWYTAQVALVICLGRFIRLFRVYQSQSFQVVHSIFKKSSFNLIALAGLGFLFAFFYAILFFHSYGYTQFNLCYKEPIYSMASSTRIESNVGTVSNSFTVHSWNDPRSSNASKTNGLMPTIDALQNIDNDGFCSSSSGVKAELYISRASSSGSSGPAKELVCNENSVYWEFDTNQQYLCTAGRVCQAGTTCRNPFFDPWTSVCSEAERRRLHRAGWDLIFENRVNDWGTTGFHSGVSTLTSLLECITLEGWSALMYRQADGDATTRGLLSFVLFLSVVILGNMLLMNLVVAVVWENTILKSTTLKTADAREEDLQLFEVLGMKWVRHLVQQLSRHDIFSSEEKMLAYQHARHQSQRDKERFGPPCSNSTGSTSLVGTPVAAEPPPDAACSACSALAFSAASSGQDPSARYPNPRGRSAACSRAFADVACDTTNVATSRWTSPGDPVTVVDVSKLSQCSRANPARLTHSSSLLPPSRALARTLLASPPSITTASPYPCATSAAAAPLSAVSCFICRVWPKFCSRVLYAISRKQYVALMFCIALVDFCCIIALTWTNHESVTLVTNCMFTLIYLIDICLQLIGFGWRQFLRDGFKVYDLIVVVVEVAGLFFHFGCCGALRSCTLDRIYRGDSTLFNIYVFFRSFHAFRIFRLIRNFAALRILVELMCDLLRNIFFIYALVLFEVFTISLMGVICFRDSHYEERASAVEFPTITLFFNFSNIWKAFILVYGLMTGESWNVVMSELFAVYAKLNYSPSEEETLLPSHLFLKSPCPAYIITTYVLITVVFLCCFIFNVFGGILIGQYVISRRSVYNRHVFKLLKVCRELGLEMPSPEAVGNENLQRMYSLVQPKNRGWGARRRALSLFLQPEKIQQRFSVACASPTARKIITRMSGSFSKPRLSSVSPPNLAHPQAAVEKPRKAAAANPHSTRKGSRRKRLRHMLRVTPSRRVQLQRRSRKARASSCVKKQHEMPSRRTACSTVTDATTSATPQAPLPSEASTLPDKKTIWALSTSTKTQSFLFYAVSHEDVEQISKNPQAEMTMGKRICSSVGAVCCSLAIAFIWIFDAVVRRFLFCLLLLERQLVSLDIDRPDFCVAYVRCILEDEDTAEQQGEHEQNSSSSVSCSIQQQTRGGVRASTCSSGSHRRVTGDLPRFELGGYLHSFLYRLMVSNIYDFFLSTANVVSLLCLIVEACLTRSSTAGFCFACLDCIFAGFFFLDSVLRMAVFGLLAGATRTNVLNLALSLSSVILLLCNQVWLLSPSLQAAYTHFWATPAFRTVKVLRSMRALQLVDTLHMDGIRIVARSLAASIGEVRNLAVLLVLVSFVVAALITQMMFCFNTPRDPSNDATASFMEIPPTGRNGKESTEDVAFPADIITNKFMKTKGAVSSNTTDSMRRPISNAYVSRPYSLAVSSGTHGVHNERADRSRAAPYTFHNMVESLIGVFVLSTAEGWPLLLAQLLEQLPEQQHTMLTVIIVVFVTLIAIICVNVFVGIIVEASRRKKIRMEMQGSLLSPAIHKWIEVQKIMFDAPLQHGDTVPDFDQGDHKRLAWFRKRAAAIVTSSYYHYFDLSQTFFLCFLLVFHGPWYDVLVGHVTRTTDKIFYSLAVILCACFVAGVVLKMVARGRFFFRDTLDILDLLICTLLVVRVLVILSLKDQRTDLKLHRTSDFWPMSFRLFRVARYLYRHVHFFRTLFTTITGVARAFLTALGLLGIALFFFALWGVLLFHDSPIVHYTNNYANFTNLLAAFMAVIGGCTGEDWHLMLQQMRLYYEERGETTLEYLVVIFFVAFIILVFFTLMCLFTSTVLEKYMETVRNESLWKISREHGRLLDLWTPDENGTLFKTLEETLRILQSIEFPVGLRNAIPPVETAEAAFALLAKFELPLYYCGKAEGNITCDFDNTDAGRDAGASYKVHIRDVVLNAARRACKFHATNNGEGVLEEGRVALDPRVTQSWVAKFPELNRIGCVYDLNHFIAAKTIQLSWRRRHIVVNGHIANPEWCKRCIVTLMRGLVATRTQRPACRTRRGSRNETRRESFREGDRARRSSADSGSYCETLVASEAEPTRGRRRQMTVDRQESCMTSSTLFDGSRRPSFARRRTKGEMGAPKRQLPVHDTSPPRPPPASFSREQPSTLKPAAVLTSIFCDQPYVDVQPTQGNDGDGGGGASRAGEAKPSATQSGRRHASAAPCLAVTTSTCPGQTNVGAQPVHRKVDEVDNLPGSIEQEQPRATESECRHASARPCLAETSSTCLDQTYLHGKPMHMQADAVDVVGKRSGQIQQSATKCRRRGASASPGLRGNACTCRGESYIDAQPVQGKDEEDGAAARGVGQVQPSATRPGRRHVSAASRLAVNPSTCPDKTHAAPQPAKREFDGGAVAVKVGQVQSSVATAGCRRTSAVPCVVLDSSTHRGQPEADRESARSGADEVGKASRGTGPFHARVINPGRRRVSAPCPTVTSAGPPWCHRSVSDNDCEERRSSKKPSQRPSPREQARGAVTLEDKRLGLFTYKWLSPERGKSELHGQHKSSQNDEVAGQTSPLKQPVVHGRGFGRNPENEANEAVSHDENVGFRVDHRGHENNAQRIPQETSATHSSVGGPGTGEDCVDDNVLCGTVVTGLVTDTLRAPSSVHYADRPSQNGEGNSVLEFNRKISASSCLKEKPSGHAGNSTVIYQSTLTKGALFVREGVPGLASWCM